VNTSCAILLQGFEAAKSLVHPGDVSDEEYVKRLVEDTVSQFGKLDVLVNNAGMAIFGPFAKTTTQDWRKLMATEGLAFWRLVYLAWQKRHLP
jgi:meso-butanediol dehydrogenase / (S,S)-butanediol dehydrogenase / diacetyl reductase